jgi:hypothetical protein
MMEGSGAGSRVGFGARSVLVTNGSGCGSGRLQIIRFLAYLSDVDCCLMLVVGLPGPANSRGGDGPAIRCERTEVCR